MTMATRTRNTTETTETAIAPVVDQTAIDAAVQAAITETHRKWISASIVSTFTRTLNPETINQESKLPSVVKLSAWMADITREFLSDCASTLGFPIDLIPSDLDSQALTATMTASKTNVAPPKKSK